MKIIIPVLTVTPSGGYRVLSEFANTWVRLGHQVTFLAVWEGEMPYYPSQAEFKWLNDNGEAMNPLKEDHFGQSVGVEHVFRKMLALFRGLHREGSAADVVLANHSLTAWPVFLTHTRAAKFYYIQADESEFYANWELSRKDILSWIALASYFLPLRQIVNSHVYLQNRKFRPVGVVPPGIDLRVMCPKKAKVRLSRQPIVLGCLGRKEPYKGIAYVLDAFALLLERNRPVKLRIAHGNLPDGRVLPAHSEIVAAHNDQELLDFYHSLDIVIAPGTLQLGAPHVPVMEAMACGIPVITTGYMPATIQANNSWIVPIRDSTAIANAVDEIMADSELREKRVQNALKDIQPFSWERVAPQMLAHFEREINIVKVNQSQGK